MRESFVITGAATGIGAATVALLVADGAKVLATDIDESVHVISSQISGPGELQTRIVDVSSEGAVQKAVAEAVGLFGRLDGIFNNAGILGPSAPVDQYSPSSLWQVFAVNVAGVFHGVRAALPELRKGGGGVILNTASTGALVAAPNQSGYVASKHAVLGLTRSVALEVASENIAVNALCPGATDTQMMREVQVGWSQAGIDQSEALARVTPTARLARPEEIASTAAWLLQKAPIYLTGSAVAVDGAQTAH